MKSRNDSKIKASACQSQQAGSDSLISSGACNREKLIAEAAYFHAERRNFEPGWEVADWLQAEADVGHLF